MREETGSKVEEYTDQDLQDMLPIYYKRLFPHKPFYRWLSYGLSENSIFTHREFSFTLMDDVYIRYLSFENETELETEMSARNPFKIDIGPVMSHRPKDHRVCTMQAVQRELIFDIDMTDYDEVRTCCSGADICQKCWKFMAIACQVIDAALREDFSFEHILWVFSGRRGIHCWVCDKIARHMNSKNRNAVAEYLNVLTVQNSATRVQIVDRMHHSLKRAYRIIEPYFEEICLIEQNVFGSSQGRKKLLDMIPDENMRKELETKINSIEENESKSVWELVRRTVQNNRSQTSMQRRLKYLIEEIQLAMLYPRLDIAVSKAANHLLKSPFCVHPKTGKICVAFNPSAVSKFDPTTVPTLRQLLKEIDQFDDKNMDSNSTEAKSRIVGYKKTGMYKGVCVFEEFIRKLESSFKLNAKLLVSDGKMDF